MEKKRRVDVSINGILLFGLVYGETWFCVPTLRVDDYI